MLASASDARLSFERRPFKSRLRRDESRSLVHPALQHRFTQLSSQSHITPPARRLPLPILAGSSIPRPIVPTRSIDALALLVSAMDLRKRTAPEMPSLSSRRRRGDRAVSLTVAPADRRHSPPLTFAGPGTATLVATPLWTPTPTQASYPAHRRLTTADDLPHELLDAIAQHVTGVEPDAVGRATLCALAQASKRWTEPAQRSLVRDLALHEPKAIDRLVRTLLRKPALGLACRSIEIRIGPADIPGDLHSTSSFRRAQECSLIALLPFLRRASHLTVAASYDCPESILALFTSLLSNITHFALTSAYGYSKLVYVGARSIANVLTNWPKLVSLSMTMPWILDDGTRHATFQPTAQLRSLELSGFRGDLAELGWLLSACRSTLTRFHFDCPLDQEPWHELGTQMIGRLGALEDLSLWSWTYELPVAEILRSCRRLKTLAISAHDVVRDDVLALMPSTLETLLVCSHIEFSRLDTQAVAAGLDGANLKQLPELILYDPSAINERYGLVQNDPAWSSARARGTIVRVTPDPTVLGCLVPKAK